MNDLSNSTQLHIIKFASLSCSCLKVFSSKSTAENHNIQFNFPLTWKQRKDKRKEKKKLKNKLLKQFTNPTILPAYFLTEKPSANLSCPSSPLFGPPSSLINTTEQSENCYERRVRELQSFVSAVYLSEYKKSLRLNSAGLKELIESVTAKLLQTYSSTTTFTEIHIRRAIDKDTEQFQKKVSQIVYNTITSYKQSNNLIHTPEDIIRGKILLAGIFRFYTRDLPRIEKESILWVAHFWSLDENSWKKIKTLSKEHTIEPPPEIIALEKKIFKQIKKIQQNSTKLLGDL